MPFDEMTFSFSLRSRGDGPMEKRIWDPLAPLLVLYQGPHHSHTVPSHLLKSSLDRDVYLS